MFIFHRWYFLYMQSIFVSSISIKTVWIRTFGGKKKYGLSHNFFKASCTEFFSTYKVFHVLTNTVILIKKCDALLAETYNK